jgi:hypothetical protein
LALVTATPLRNPTPSIVLGTWFSPFSRRHFVEAAFGRARTTMRAVVCDSAPLARAAR